MINIMYAVDPIKRIVKPMSGHVVTEQDHEASSLRFAFPDNIAGTGLESTGIAVRVMYIRPDGGDPVAKTLAFYGHSGGYYLYDWNLQKSDLQKEGRLVFSLCILNIAEGEVEEWHTIPYQIRVLGSIHTDDSDEADETITPTVAERVAVLETMIQRVASGAPIVVTSTSAMTETDRIYVLTTDKKWYYYDGSAWTAGGEYGAVSTDRTLSMEGIPADAKAVGVNLKSMDSELTQGINDLRIDYGANLFNPYELKKGIFLNGTTGEEMLDSHYDASDYIAVHGTYTVKVFEYSGSGPRIRIYRYNADKTFYNRMVQPMDAYTFTWTGYIRINIDNSSNAYENPYKYMLVSGSNVPSEFVPYYTANDRFARSNFSNAVVNYKGKYDFSDLNDINNNSIYYVSPSFITNHYPQGFSAAYIETVVFNDSNRLQIITNAYGDKRSIRSMVAGVWSDWVNIQLSNNADYVTKEEEYITSTIALFPAVGCCGDSFTAGYLYNKPESAWYDPNYVPNGEYPKIAYPAVMGRLYGIEVTPYAQGGLTSTGYRTASKALPALLNDDPKYLYIIALGLNDKTQNIPIGVEADIDTEPSTPSYLGNMGYIIRAIQNHAPYARIILCKSLWMATTYYDYISEGVELLSSHLGIPYIETKGDPFFESPQYKNGLKGLHPTAPLYAGIGKRIGELVGKCVIDNPEYFYNFYVPNE